MRLVSVIITTYGRTMYLKEAIESVVAQTYPNIELIIVDDNAELPDIRKDVENIVKDYATCRYIKNERNLGGSLSRNEGIKAAKGEMISFLDDDDMYFPTRIEEYLKAYDKETECHVGIIYDFVVAISDVGRKIREYNIVPEEKPLLQHMQGCMAATSQWMVPAQVFQNVGMFEDSPSKQDSIMLLKILGAGYQPLCVPQVLNYYRMHNNGRISGNTEKNYAGLENFHSWCKEYYDHLSLGEIERVERAFAKQKLTIDVMIGNRKDARKQLRIMQMNHASGKELMKDFIKCFMPIVYNLKTARERPKM